MVALLLAALLGTGLQAEAEAVVAEVLQGVDGGKVKVRLFPTQAGMEAAVGAKRTDFAAWYDYRTNTIFAFGTRMSGLLLGALVHEAQHARGAFLFDDYRRRSHWQREGEADRDAVLFLRGSKRPGAGTWEFLLQSRRVRLHERNITAAPKHPGGLTPGMRATWYTLAFADALQEPMPQLEWVLRDGIAEPFAGGYRLVSQPRQPARIARWRGRGRLEFDVENVTKQVDLYHGPHKIAFLKRGAVRAMWRKDGKWVKDRLHPAPPLEGRTRIAIEDGAVIVNGRVVLYVQQDRGRLGIGAWDGAADVWPRPSS